MRFAFEVIFVKIYNSLSQYFCCLRERKNWWVKQDGRFFLTKGHPKDLKEEEEGLLNSLHSLFLFGINSSSLLLLY
jgi:hypothetical protein